MRTKQFMTTNPRNKATMELRAHLLKEELLKKTQDMKAPLALEIY